jgi:hypothetical protein
VTNEDGATTGGTWSIKFATVTINTLTINGKQVTLDVFRQLKEAVLINHDGSLAGSPWGLINYHQKRCDKLDKHAHVVWQLDDQLRQDTIQPPRWEPYRSDTCDALVFAYGTVESSPSITMRSGPPEDSVRPRRSRPSWPRLAARAILMLFQPPPDPLQPPPEEPEQPPPADPEPPARFDWKIPKFGRIQDRKGMDWLIFLLDGIECGGYVENRFGRFGGPELAAEHAAADRAALLAQLKNEVAAEKERRARHEARWAEILDLAQLFIAV